MALKKSKEIKGYTAEYWKITEMRLDLMNSSLTAQLHLFKDRPTREEGLNNSLTREVFRWTSQKDFLTIAYMTTYQVLGYVYSKIKESKKIQSIIDNVPQFEEDGVTPIMVETNWYADAEDIMEM